MKTSDGKKGGGKWYEKSNYGQAYEINKREEGIGIQEGVV